MIKKKVKAKKMNGIHFSGLDIPNIPVTLTLSEAGIVIVTSTLQKEYTIDIGAIKNISCYHEEEFEKYMKSSLVGGVIGAAAFGVPGAIIGSRPKEKSKRKVTFYLLVDYSDKQIVISSEDGFSIGSIVDLFRAINPQTNSVQSI